MVHALPSVLIVEDDLDTLEMERAVLELAGFAVMVAPNGRAALDVLQHCRPGVILLDLMMPVMDGLSFLAERRSRHLHEDVPVVCLSAGGPEMLSEALDLGAAECLAKPQDLDTLCDRVAHYCSS